MPKVTVITNFYNTEKFLEEAIQSVISQTYEDWELLCVDDGSTDGSTAIAQKYAHLIPQKIHYFEHPGHINRGISATRNFGISHAQGEYIAFLDADDVWLPQKLEIRVKNLDFNPQAAMVYGPILYWHGWTAKPEDIKRDRISPLGVIPENLFEPPELMTHYLRHGGCVPATCSTIMVRKSVFDQVGGFQEDLKLFEDQAFYAKIALNFSIYVDKNPLSKYRQHLGSVCAIAEKTGYYNSKGGPNEAELIFLNWLSAYILQQESIDPYLQMALTERRFPYDHPFVFNLVTSWEKFCALLKFRPTYE